MFISKDRYRAQNIGNYRAMVKPDQAQDESGGGVNQGSTALAEIRRAANAGGAGAGGAAVVTFRSQAAKHLDEIAVAGGLVGAPIRVCKAKTVDRYFGGSRIVVEGYRHRMAGAEGSFGDRTAT
jgi:UbiD family decarboxylase